MMINGDNDDDELRPSGGDGRPRAAAPSCPGPAETMLLHL